MSFIRDITERKKSEKKLKKNEEQLRNIFENSTNLFYSHTVDHVLTYLSPQVEQILGYTMEEALTKWTEFATDHPVNEILFPAYNERQLIPVNVSPLMNWSWSGRTGKRYG